MATKSGKGSFFSDGPMEVVMLICQDVKKQTKNSIYMGHQHSTTLEDVQMDHVQVIYSYSGVI